MEICFTIYKLTEDRREVWSKILEAGLPIISYVECQEETGATGQKHLQGYMVLRWVEKYNDIKKLFRGKAESAEMWLCRRKGTVTEAKHYCRKPFQGCGCKHCKTARSVGGGYNGGMKGQWKRKDATCTKCVVHAM